MEILGFAFEVLFFAIGIYVYLFSRGFIKGSSNPEVQQRALDFRIENGWWLRLLSLALVAIMGINIVLHIMQYLND